MFVLFKFYLTFCKNSDVNLKLLTMLAKRSILDAWPGPECVSVGKYKTVLKIQTEISPWQQVNMAI